MVFAHTLAKLGLIEDRFVTAQPEGLTDVRHRFGVFSSTREPDLDKPPESFLNVVPAPLAKARAFRGRPVAAGTRSNEPQRLQQHVPGQCRQVTRQRGHDHADCRRSALEDDRAFFDMAIKGVSDHNFKDVIPAAGFEPEQRRRLPQSVARAPVRGNQQDPICQRQ